MAARHAARGAGLCHFRHSASQNRDGAASVQRNPTLRSTEGVAAFAAAEPSVRHQGQTNSVQKLATSQEVQEALPLTGSNSLVASRWEPEPATRGPRSERPSTAPAQFPAWSEAVGRGARGAGRGDGRAARARAAVEVATLRAAWCTLGERPTRTPAADRFRSTAPRR